MKCTRCQERLQDFLDETLEPAEQAELAEHLAACEACRGELEALRKLAALVGSLDEVPEPEGFLQGVRARLERVSVWERMRDFLTRPLRPGYSVAIPVIIVAFFVVFLLMNPRVPERARESQPEPRNAPSFDIARHEVESPVPRDETTGLYMRGHPTVEGPKTEETRDHSLDAGSGGATPGKPSLKSREESTLEKDKLNLKPKTDTYRETDSDHPKESEAASTATGSAKVSGSLTDENLREKAPTSSTEEMNKSLEDNKGLSLRDGSAHSADETAGARTGEHKEANGEVPGEPGREARSDVIDRTEKKETKDETAAEQETLGTDLGTITLGGTERTYQYQKRAGDEVIYLVVRDLPADRAHVERIVADAAGQIT
jgi:hypothetical protein